MTTVALVVDDEPSILDLTSAILEDLGYEVQSAGCAAEALTRIDEGPRIGLLITDVQMPGMSGYELAASSISPWAGSGVSASTSKIGSGIYLVIVAVMASSIGGYLPARLRTKWTGLHTK
jgi:CheY-like chemotaxis protein